MRVRVGELWTLSRTHSEEARDTWVARPIRVEVARGVGYTWKTYLCPEPYHNSNADYYDSAALLERLTVGVKRARHQIIFLVGSALTAPTEPSMPGVPGVEGVIDIIRNEFEGTDQVYERIESPNNLRIRSVIQNDFHQRWSERVIPSAIARYD